LIFFKSHKTFCQQWRLYSESVNLDEREEPLVFPAFLFLLIIIIFHFVGKLEMFLVITIMILSVSRSLRKSSNGFIFLYLKVDIFNIP